MNPAEILDKLVSLSEKYALTDRKIVTKERMINSNGGKLPSVEQITMSVFQEPLIEHVGHLPIIATTLHPHVSHTKDIDLGKVLIMLAIHDIAETELGDKFSYDKNKSDEQEEYELALSLLDESQRDVFEEYEERETLEAKFAKAVDSISPIVHDLGNIEIFDVYNDLYKFDEKMVEAKKRKHFAWDEVLNEIFSEAVERYKNRPKRS